MLMNNKQPIETCFHKPCGFVTETYIQDGIDPRVIYAMRYDPHPLPALKISKNLRNLAHVSLFRNATLPLF